MSFFNPFVNARNNKNILYVVDRLLDFAVRDWSGKKIDHKLYQILNRSDVYQEAIHMGLYPVVGENKSASPEFIRFIENLWMYIEYDVRTDFLWAHTVDNPGAQKSIHEKMVAVRKDILQYLLDKKLITGDEFSSELTRKVKSLTD